MIESTPLSLSYVNREKLMLETNTDTTIGFYLKFYERKIHTIHQWDTLFQEIFLTDIPIYVWIEANSNPYDLNVPYKDKIIYISHYNKHTINQNIDKYESIINDFCKNVGIHDYQIHIANAHLKSFLFPNTAFVVHLDGDDMFYNDLKLSDILNVHQYMQNNNLEILSRPFHITVNHGWSFGFVIQKRSIFNKMFILDYENLSDDYKKQNFYNRNIDEDKAMNLDNYFGMILLDIYNKKYNELFFYFNNHLYWNNSINNDNLNITNDTTKLFCETYNIKGI